MSSLHFRRIAAWVLPVIVAALGSACGGESLKRGEPVRPCNRSRLRRLARSCSRWQAASRRWIRAGWRGGWLRLTELLLLCPVDPATMAATTPKIAGAGRSHARVRRPAFPENDRVSGEVWSSFPDRIRTIARDLADGMADGESDRSASVAVALDFAVALTRSASRRSSTL